MLQGCPRLSATAYWRTLPDDLFFCGGHF